MQMRLDLRYALRGFVRAPGFSIAAILTLALAIGSVTAIFSVADAILFRALPYPDSNRLVMVWDQLRKLGVDQFPLREETFAAYSGQGAVFQSSAAFRLEDGNLTGAGDPEHLIVLAATPNLFAMTGAVPMLGRGFTADDHAVAILSHALFLRRFGGRADIIGQSIRLDDRSFTVAGVLPAGFAFSEIAESPDVWIPLERNRDGQWGAMSMLAELRPGVSIGAAQSALDGVAKHLEETLRLYRGPNGEDAGYGVKVVSLRDQILGRFRFGTWILLCAVAAVLLIALVNLAHLLLVRAVSREKEFAVRRAVGATEARLIRQWMTEGALLSVLGGSLGAVASIWGVRALIALSPAALPDAAKIAVDTRALAVTLAISVIVCAVSGLAPAIRPRRSAPLLVTAETALALMLLIGAGLLLKSFVELSRVNAGFNPEHVLTMQVELPHSPYPEARERIEFYSSVHDRLAALPGVIAAGEVSRLPVDGAAANPRGGNPFSIEGRPWNPSGAVPQIAHTMAAGPDYFRAMQIPLLAGRVFNASDTENSPHVAVINETLARGFFPKGDAIGQHIMLGAPRSGYPWMTIVGIAGDVKTAGLNEAAVPQFYAPLTQDASPFIALVIRTTGDPMKMARQAAAMVHSIDPGRPVYDIQTMEQHVSTTIRQPRFVTMIAAFFAAVALFLSGVGIFGVVAQATVQRSKEIGLRMALGADANRVLGFVIGGGLRPVIAGVALGIAGALALTRMLSSVLFHVEPDDPAMFLLAAVVLTAVALTACLIPARKATRIDPMAALRSE